MRIYKRFEDFVKTHGTLVETRESYGGMKTVWQMGNRTVVIDENPFEESDRIVIVILEKESLIGYLSPSAVRGGAVEQLAYMMKPGREPIFHPSRLERILEELSNR